MSDLTHDLTAFDYAPLLARELGTSTEEIETALSNEIAALTAWLNAREFGTVDRWPFDRGPDGPVRTQHGELLHGAACSAPHSNRPTFDLLIANNGFPLSAVRCAGPIPPALPLMSPSICVVANTGSLVQQPRGLMALDPDEAAFNLVIHRHKPVALLTADDSTVVERCRHLAAEHGCDVHVEHVEDDCCGPASYWFVDVARPEPLGGLLALDDLVDWWAAALPAVGLGPLRGRVRDDLLALTDQHASEFLGRSAELVMAPLCDDPSVDGLPTWVVGAVLGYWPPTSLALMLNHGHRGTLVPAAGDVSLRTWGALHGVLTCPA